MENIELDRVKSLEMLKELQTEHKNIKNNPELLDIQKKVTQQKKKEENQRYKAQSDPEILQDARQRFQNSLNKLNSIDTRQIALKEAKEIIKSFNSIEALKIYISSLTEHRKSKDAAARELEVSLLGYLSEIYKESLVEPDSSLKTLKRLAEVIQSYFKDLNRAVHRAAGIALCDLYRYSLPKSSQSVVFSFIFDPLSGVLTAGIDVQVQQAAALSLFIWIECLKQESDQGNLVLVYSKLIPLFLKLRAEYMDLLNAIGLLTESCGFQVLIENLAPFLTKMIGYLKHPSVNAFPLKTAACQLIGYVGKHLTDISHQLDPFPSEILNALRELKTEKIPALQAKAREALRIWEIYRASLLEQPIDLSPKPAALKKIEPESHFRSIRTLVKMQKEKMKKQENKETESPWGLPKVSYLKKGTGNYVVCGQGEVNITRALEKRQKVAKTKWTSAEEVKVFYKEGDEVKEYINAPQKVWSVVDKPSGDASFISSYKVNKFQRESAESNENKSEGKSSCKFNDTTSVTESRETLKEDLFQENAEKQEKKIESQEKLGKIIEEEPEKLNEEEKEPPVFMGFIRENSYSTEIMNPGSPLKALRSQSKVLLESDHTESPLKPEDFTLNPQEIEKKEKPEDFTLNPIKKKDSKSLAHIQLISSQNIEIKPPVKRSIIRDFSIQNQEPFKVLQPPVAKRSLSTSKQAECKIKGIQSKEIQTSVHLQDTPRFSIDKNTEKIESLNTQECVDVIIGDIEDLQAVIENKFSFIGEKLFQMEERLAWVDDSCKCVKQFRKVQKKIRAKQKTLSEVSLRQTGHKNDKLTTAWAEVLNSVEQGKTLQAYRQVLDTADDIYLLRLMIKTGPCLYSIEGVAETVFAKLVATLQSRFIERIGIEWIAAGLQSETTEDLQGVFQALENIKCKGGEEAEQSEEICNYLLSSNFN